MYLVHTPKCVQSLFSGFTWKMPASTPQLFLTFDDGPIPEVTPWVLETLREYNAKATFFCVGDNVRRYPDVFDAVLDHGHTVGNHTFNHLSGWKTENDDYFDNIKHCSTWVDSPLFRPPYGKIKPSQILTLRHQYQIVLWDVLSGDFDKDLTPEECLQNVIHHATPGSIIVFHDSLKAEKNLRYALPKVLEYFTDRGFTFEAIPAHRHSTIEQPFSVAV